MKNKISLLVIGVLVFVAANAQEAEDIQKLNIQPNIVFILADDMGVGQLGCYGSEYYKTPNIDSIAEEGVKFTDAYAAAAVCSPTRASIMTGKYPARLHLTDYIPGRTKETDVLNTPKWQQFLPLREITFGEVLIENGYKTGLIGKWHLSKEKRPPVSLEHNPDKQGFQETFVTYKPSKNLKKFWQTADNDAHNIDTITTRSIDFMRKNRNKPFFLMVSHNAIHDPLMSKNELIKKYIKHPLNNNPENHPVIGAMVESLDNSVGRILDEIKELRIENNTIVVFFADNGGKAAYVDQKPFREGKGWLYEGGIREPLIIKWPNRIKANSTSKEMVSSIDFFPTFLEMTGLSIPQTPGLDGKSMMPLFDGRELKREALYWHYPHYHYGSGMVPASAIRYGDYKLIEWYDKKLTGDRDYIELYNLKEDINEQKNLVKSNPDLVKKLLIKLEHWKKEVGAQIPTIKE
ncbi:putative sulfatase [Maribacter vaceletii]|uniref:Putative sulfatase n=1 Tax=Maribacter vaceletii TaxID=1206816 RepID=A0A495DV11_9FLAO|nr:sulfatase [Maribacter vaceletii]RKR08029.1 putative sulfatase [Maribacter vaceletii]